MTDRARELLAAIADRGGSIDSPEALGYSSATVRALVRLGYVERVRPNGDAIRLTAAGLDAAGQDRIS